jgi:subtilisin family serine protease
MPKPARSAKSRRAAAGAAAAVQDPSTTIPVPEEPIASPPPAGDTFSLTSPYSGNGEEFTGRFLVAMPEGDGRTARSFAKSAGIAVASSHDFSELAGASDSLGDSEMLVFAELGVAVVAADPDKTQALMAGMAEENPLSARMEPERYVYPIAELDYLRGYRDGVNDLSRRLRGAPFEEEERDERIDYGGRDEEPSEPAAAGFTWGIQAVRADRSTAGGLGILVAVLDTGFDLTHPDFRGRAIIEMPSFTGETALDVLGHGTHCIGSACGPRVVSSPQIGRYGVAWQSTIVVGKVFDRVTRRAPDSRILAGIAEAVRRRCPIVSMSLGAPVVPGQRHNSVMEMAAARALAAGTLIIAAAGNDSRRPQDVRPVSHPANCPSIMAVAAVDSRLRVASFSNGGINPGGGKIDICGPGVAVPSSWPMPQRYRTIDGTSMATPHVAGCAALHAQTSGLRGGALWARLTSTARPLPLRVGDVGAGLVQAP